MSPTALIFTLIIIIAILFIDGGGSGDGNHIKFT